MNSKVTIKEFEPAHYKDYVQLFNLVYPDIAMTVDEMVELDEKRDSRCKFGRFVAVLDDRIIGWGQYTQYMYKFDPHKFYLSGAVLEEFYRQGIGAKLYNIVIDALKQSNPRLLDSHVRDDRVHGISFLEKRGFCEYMREGVSILDPAKFDFTPYKQFEGKLSAQGIEIKTLRELKVDPNRNRKIYDLDWQIALDVPHSENSTQLDFNKYVSDILETPARLQDGYFVAVHGDEYVGLCSFTHHKADNSVYHGATGVRRDYRRRGIALCLKVRSIQHAKKMGYSLVKTDNEVNNRPMLAINERLGYIRDRDWIFFKKIMEVS